MPRTVPILVAAISGVALLCLCGCGGATTEPPDAEVVAAPDEPSDGLAEPAAVELPTLDDPMTLASVERLEAGSGESGSVAADPLRLPAIEPSEADALPTLSDGAATEDADAVDPRLYGSWALEYHGDWICTLQPGGGGSTSVEFDWAAALLYGSRIDFDLEWAIVDGKLVETLTSGTPKANYDALVRDHGKTRTYEIIALTDETLTLRSVKDDLVSKWKRVQK